MMRRMTKKVTLKDRDVDAKKAKKIMGGSKASPKLFLACAMGQHVGPGVPTGQVVFKVDGNPIG